MLHGDVLGERARLTPDAEALVEVATARRFSYRTLDERAIRWATVLRSGLNLSKGDRVGLLCGNRVEFLDVFFAAAKSGIVLVPMNTHLAAPELELIAVDAGLSALIYDGAFKETVRLLRTRIEIEVWVALDEADHEGDLPASTLLASIETESFQREAMSPDDICALLYTSGTTGRPKGVMIPHRMVAWNGYNTVVGWQLRSDDVSPIFTPLYHAGGLGAFLLPVMTVGGTIVLHQAFDPDEVWQTIQAEHCTVVLGVPAVWKLLADHPAFETTDLSHVRWFISGGAPLPPVLIDRYRQRGIVLRQGYGLTEVGVNCFAMTDADAWSHSGSIGKPMMFTEAAVIDEDGREVGEETVGELVFRGPHVSAGYWKNDEATRASYDTEGFFHTGDLARKDADGFFYIAGRRKEMYISGGINIFPAEVEAVLLQHPEIMDAAVVGVPHETWGEVGAAFLVLRTGDTMDIDALKAWLERRISRYKVPKYVNMIQQLPRTAYGKVRRSELVNLFIEKGGNQ